MTDHDAVPYLWGDWRSWTPDFYTAWCSACGGELWIGWSAGQWRVSCENGCALEAIDAGAGRLADAQQARYDFEREARATMDDDDPFHGIDAVDYIAALTGLEDRRGWFRCPFHAEGQERTPSLHATGIFWYCQACHKGGSIYDFGAELWGIEPRKAGFVELRERLGRELLRAAT